MTKIQSLFDRYKKAVFDKDVDAFLSIFDSDIRIFDMWDQWSLHGINAWRTSTAQWFGSLGTERVLVDFKDQHIVVSGEMGYATAFVTFEAVSAEGKSLRSLQNRVTWVLQKKSGQWKVIHEHTSAPIHHETAKAILKQ